ncbi:MAG: hypothetical protein ACYS30_08350 [Planctomycetota bacterium]|jgi:hypothetical protein
MSLKTAALIAFFGVAVRFCLAVSTMMLQLVGVSPFGSYMPQVFWVFNTIIFYGSLILFFAVFYSKQKQ